MAVREAQAQCRLLLVDDSAAYRSALGLALSRDASLFIVGEASDGEAALILAERLRPDVVLLDLMMPRLNGIDTARAILRDYGDQTSVVLLSALARLPGSAEHREAVAALPAGVVTLHDKPTLVGPNASVEALIRSIKQAQIERLVQLRAPRLAARVPPQRCSVIAIAASTGGLDALRQLLDALPSTAPPVVVAQHMAPGSQLRFAQQLQSCLRAPVVAVGHTAELQAGTVFVAARHAHMELRANEVAITEAEPNQLAASANRLFLSAARTHGASAWGLVLTGMGQDGARGLLALREAGAWTVAQDDQSSLVYGMPKAAAEAGACCEVLSLREISWRIQHLLASVHRSPR